MSGERGDASIKEWETGPRCPEALDRAAMSDTDFEAHVARSLNPPALTPEQYDDTDDDLGLDPAPCPECGEVGACAYDAEGRPMTHMIANDESGRL